MENSNISLNFLEITPKEFSIKFFWKKLDEIPQEEHIGLYKRNLSLQNTDKRYENLAIVFKAKEGFKEENLGHNFDLDLTKQYLFNTFKNACNRFEIFNTSKDKHHRIYFILNKHKEGTETVWIEPYFLSKTNAFGFLLDFKFFVDEEYHKTITSPVDKRILQLSGTLDTSGKSNKEFYIFKLEKIKMFLLKFYKKINKFGINNDFFISPKLSSLSSILLEARTYQFRFDKENKSPYYGLQANPPLEKPLNETDFIFVFKETDRNIAIDLLKGLQGKSFTQQFPGIEFLFRIPFENKNIIGKKVKEINEKILLDLIKEIKDYPKNLLPIILTNSKTSKLDEELYYKIKYIFTSNNIPCQVVTKDLINNSYTLKYSLSNIGLQIFAKAGGKPWKVKPAVNDCLIIGIGTKNKESFIQNSNKTYTRKIEKYFTYSILTDSSGLFKEIQILSEDEKEESYYSKLVTRLKSIIEKAIQEGNKNIVIHTPHKMSKEKVWDKVFKNIPNDIIISILIINNKHKYFGFDLSKNSLVPYESSCVSISEYEYLIWFEGLQLNNSAFTKPIGGPIYINFWYSSNIENLKKQEFRKMLLQDCINLSGANWRGFKAKQLPVSIYYCQKISEFLTKFEEYHYENIDINNLKPWFL
jgi:hypothetical protein